jgi:predicted acylesterase/phospholipase RssA
VLGACASQRTTFAVTEQRQAIVADMPNARVWADDPAAIARFRTEIRRQGHALHPHGITVLSLSGGAADGAFGAGLLAGWSEQGSRPVFSYVIGVSVGGLIAPFAFLGSRYDTALKRLFEDGEAASDPQLREFSISLGPQLSRPHPLERPITRYVDQALLDAVAAEHRKGRRLLVATTNLDAQRTAIWDMGAIAASNHPRALELFRNVLMASASVPAVFPPVLIDVAASGRRFREMHVDGGVSANVLIAPEVFFLSPEALEREPVRPRLFVLVNSKLSSEFAVVPDSMTQLALRSVSTLIKANLRSTLIANYDFARRKGWEFNLVAIDPGFPASAPNGLDPAYMQRLFRYGQMKGRSGNAWRSKLDDLRAEYAP